MDTTRLVHSNGHRADSIGYIVFTEVQGNK